MIVFSTGNTPPHPRCLTSVAEQEGSFTHEIRTDPRRSYSTNLLSLADGLDPEEIIVAVDADDWLAHTLALERVAEAHGAGAWVTYGSYRFADGRPAPWQRAYAPGEDPRRAPWQASHLKSFRAGLVQRLTRDTFDLEHGRDQALMLPLLEMAGPRAVFIPEVLYVYNWASSFEFSASPGELQEEARQVAAVRARAPYTRAESL